MGILDGLNSKQKEAVLQTEGPVLILAGAGSGKTKTLTHRIAFLIKEKKVSPFNILVVTFTNKAAAEMGERVARLLVSRQKGAAHSRQPRVSMPWLGTFHSICVRVLRREIERSGLGFSRRFTIWDEQDCLSAIKRILRDLAIDPKQCNPQGILANISGAKNELINAKEYKSWASGYYYEIVSRVYDRYESLAWENNALDFDDLLVKCLEMFERNPNILKKYQEQFHYILVDEYQDTNKAQYLLIKKLAERHRNLFVIGDDYQSIYSWRGADFRNILNFEKDWPEAKIIKLEQNYRSTQTILDAGQAIIENNKNRTDKKMWTEEGVGDLISVVHCLNERDEGEFILREIQRLVRSSQGEAMSGRYRLDDFVVLYRTNAQSRVIEEVFVKHHLPYRIVGGIKFYERKEVKDVLAFLHLLENPLDVVSLERVINVPPRGIGEKNLGEILKQVKRGKIENKKGRNFFDLLDRIRANFQNAKPDEIIIKVVEMSGLKGYLLDGTVEGEGRWENVKELATAASGFSTLSDFLDQVALVQDTDESLHVGHAMDGVVTLMTLHSSKGLEYPVVFIAGMEEGVMPHCRSVDEIGKLEEERRLCYVGITRAKQKLYLLYAEERRLWGSVLFNQKSRFIDEIPEHLVEEI